MIVAKEIEKFLCSGDTKILEALRRLNSIQELFQVIVDSSGRLLGTLTDGDIRRALLGGVDFEDHVSTIMFTHPTTGLIGDDEVNARKLEALGSSRSFLPLVNTEKLVQAILLGDGASRAKHALVMAGGFGTRLGERTLITPKPLLPVNGQPMLDHVIQRLESASVEHLYVSVHYLASQVRSYLNDRGNVCNVTVLEEDVPLGTAGALGLLPAVDEPVLVVNADVLSEVDYQALHDFHHRHGLEATVAVARHDIDVPFGVVRYDDDGLFNRIEEKPRISNFVAAGIYYLSPELIALVPKAKPIDMPELLTLGRQIGLKIGLFPIHEYWTDVGQPDDLEAADQAHSYAAKAKTSKTTGH